MGNAPSVHRPICSPIALPGAGSSPLKGGNPFAKTDAILGPGGADYAFLDSSLMATLFQDAAGTTPVTAIGQLVGRQNVRKKSPHYASQSVNNSRPVLQSDGLKFDGSDDSELSDWLFGAGANCIVAQVTVPAVLSTGCFIAGVIGASAGRFRLGVLASGLLQAGVGDQTVFPGATMDVRGQTVVVGLTASGGTARIFAGSTQQSSVAYTGAAATNVAAMFGASSGNGTAQQFFPGSVKRIAFGRVDLSLSDFQQIRNEWLAAA